MTRKWVTDKTSINTGKRIYTDLCARCHGVDLQGDGPVAPALKTSPTNLSKMSGNHSDGDFAWKMTFTIHLAYLFFCQK